MVSEADERALYQVRFAVTESLCESEVDNINLSVSL
jgi:hypothetical protein